MKIELVSFRYCPFVQRSVIMLLHKQVAFETVFIDLSEKPEWFNKISPLGKVPLLRLMQTHIARQIKPNSDNSLI